MKLTTITQVTLDGVMQGNGEATQEERRNGFERGGWARGQGDQETDAFINQAYQRAGVDDFVYLGCDAVAALTAALDAGGES